MKRKTRKLLIIAISTATVMAVLIAVYYCGVSISALRTDWRLYENLRELNHSIRGELKMYYEQEGSYPEKLDALIPTIVNNRYTASVPEKPKELEMLSHFKYSSDGTTYTMIWSFKNYTHKEYGKNGILVKIE